MKLGKLLGKVVAAPIALAVSLPEIAADAVDEIAKAAGGKAGKA